jgi:diguanylate cyclase (GGDEF)-like protein/PAS domain S-box-containing protein
MKTTPTPCNTSISPLLAQSAFEALLHASPCPIVLQDEQGCILKANTSFCEQFGFERGAVMGQDLNRLILPHSRIEEGKRIDRTIAQGGPIHQETIRHMADGTPLQVHLTAIPIVLAGHLIARLAVYWDITPLRRAEQKYSDIFTNAVEGIFQTTPEGRYLEANPALARIYGYESPEELMNDLRNIGEQLYVDPKRRDVFLEHMRTAGRVSHFESQIRRKDGSVIWIAEHARSVYDEKGKLRYFEGTVVDITKRKRAEFLLKASEEEYRTIFETTGTASVIIENDNRIGRANSEFFHLTGYGPEKIARGLTFEDIVAPADREQIVHVGKNEPTYCLTQTGPYELRIRTSMGAIRDVVVTEAMLNGSRRRVVSLLDITERKKAELMLRHQAFHDPLTNLPNRFLLMDRLEHALRRAKRGDNHFAILFLDMDRFKLINDSLGHVTGDRLLEQMAGKVRSCLREEDTLARFGGDEFVILIEDLRDPPQPVRIAQRILQSLKEPVEVDGNTIYISTSIGIVLGSPRYIRAEQIVRDADTAMYRAKAMGKGCYAIFDEAMHTSAVKRLDIENKLRKGIEQNQFILHYQPIINLITRSIVGFESLVRWNHPEKGIVDPDEFIPIAEETGLIVPLGEYVLLESCRQMKNWMQQYPFLGEMLIHVNVSGIQLKQLHFIDRAQHCLHRSGLPAHCLKLEITESMLMSLEDKAIALLEELKGLRIQIGIDDFGTGYSSLSYLHRFPVDTLKIDRSFVMDLDPENENAKIVKTIISLAHALGMNVVAEGIESPGQLKILEAMCCEYGQGYHFSRPVPARQVVRLLESA